MSQDLEWIRSSGRGRVYSFSVVHTRFFGQPWELPYTVALIQKFRPLNRGHEAAANGAP